MKFLLASVSILIFTMISGTQQLIVMTGGSALPNYNITEELGADMEIRRLETTRYVSLNTNDEEAQKLTNLDWGIRHWRLVTYLSKTIIMFMFGPFWIVNILNKLIYRN